MDGSRVSVNYCKIFVFPHTKKVLRGKHVSAVLQEHSKSIYAMHTGCILLLHIAMCKESFFSFCRRPTASLVQHEQGIEELFSGNCIVLILSEEMASVL